jgi:hypothetical protein
MATSDVDVSREADVPDLIPARMLNEFCYCPRLAYLEWVQGEFADNLETREGRFGHRRVDKASRAEVPEPGGEVSAEGRGTGRATEPRPPLTPALSQRAREATALSPWPLTPDPYPLLRTRSTAAR